MVSFWPWKGDPSSPASFEKTLSALSSKITDAQARLDRLHTNSRRVRVLWTLYLGFAYLVYAIVLLLVEGYKNLGAYHWAGIVGGPLIIYLTRTVITSYFNFHTNTLSSRLKAHQTERAKTIQKLKDATKYDSTLELIEKYGGAENKSKGKNKGSADEFDENPAHKKGSRRGRTNLPPPPTANIVRRSPEESTQQRLSGGDDNANQLQSFELPGAEFAPNAFSHDNPPPAPRVRQRQYMTPETHWYDRIFDVLLGEDETAAKNRFALICQHCRLVNGQAPPGTKSLAEVGMWRCSSCEATNGEIDEGKRIVEEVLGTSSTGDVDEPAAEVVEDAQVPESQAGREDNSQDVSTTGTDGPSGAVKARKRAGRK